MFLDVLLVGLARHPRHNVACQHCMVVRVTRIAGRKHPLRHIRDHEFAHRQQVLGIPSPTPEIPFFESRRMGHQVLEGDRLWIGIRDAKVEIGVDIRVQVQLALLDELHHRRPGERLAD